MSKVFIPRTDSNKVTPKKGQKLADLVGSVDGLPADLASRKKHYLGAFGYGRKRSR